MPDGPEKDYENAGKIGEENPRFGFSEAGEMKKLSNTKNEDADHRGVVDDEDGVGKEGKKEGDKEGMVGLEFLVSVDEI